MTHVLLVDDSETDRLLFRRLMEKEPNTKVDVARSAPAALAAIESRVFDVVVTDMQMPEMNGLELTRAIRSGHPELPVVLLTGTGNEELAIQSLRDGASSYVAKSLAAELLAVTVQRVVALASTSCGIDRVVSSADGVQIQLSLRNDPVALPGVVTMAQSLAKGISQTSSTGIIQLGAAVDAALSNALFRGNLQIDGRLSRDEQISVMRARVNKLPYRNRRIEVRMNLRNDELKILVSDDGHGFDHRESSEMGLSLSGRRAGRGLFLMWAFMDRVVFNHAGNRVTLVKNAFTEQKHHATQDAGDTDWGSLESADGSKMIRLTKPRIVIGRDSSCDIRLNGDPVSSHHCILYVREGFWFVRDMQSSSGIHVDSVRSKGTRLSPGAKLTVGKHAFIIRYTPRQTAFVSA